MGNNDLLNSENILIKVDQNNLVYIDPNSVIEDGEIAPRGIKQENLVMFANLEADIVPRSYLTSDQSKNTLVSIAEGTINFLSNTTKDGETNVKYFDTSWTNAYNGLDDSIQKIDSDGNNVYGGSKRVNSDSSSQSFGIESIDINTKGFNAIPQVTINFIDVRGKTLFESPENSPYKAFFHLPWPIFYLTIKGYFGKAIRYRLHLVKFNTKFNGSTGNFEITCNFVGSTYAYLNDIPLNGMLNAPYMYPVETVKDGTVRLNPDNETYEQVIAKTSRGYEVLKSVYNEYKQKGLIDPNFPVKTLKELLIIAESLDKILERQIFNEVIDAEIFAAVVEYEKCLIDFENSAVSWGNKNLSPNQGFPFGSVPFYYYFANTPNTDKTKGVEKITGSTKEGTLEYIITRYQNRLNNEEKLTKLILDRKKNKSNFNFNGLKLDNQIKSIREYYDINSDGKVGVAIDKLINDIRSVINNFVKQKSELEKLIEQKMNEVVKDPKRGFGFDPTIRNIFAVVLANAEVYIRLLKDVHTKAFEQGKVRKNVIGNLSDETPDEGAIYPWPEIKKNVGGGSKHKVITHPTDSDIINQIRGNDKLLWPEVDFIDNYEAIATKKIDTLTEKESGIGNINFIFSSDIDENKIKKLSTIDVATFGLPYTNKTLVSILYEIYERSFYSTLFDDFDVNSTIGELATIEFENLFESVKDDYDITDVLSKITSVNDYYNKMKGSSIFEKYPYLKDQLPTTPYIQDILETPYTLEQYYFNDQVSGRTKNGRIINSTDPSSYTNLQSNLKNYKPEPYRLNYYPFSSNLYLDYINQPSITDNDFVFNNILSVDTKNGLVTSKIDGNIWIKDQFKDNLFSNKINISNSLVHVLNTPFFHKQLYSDFNNNDVYGKYAGSAYLLINSLPFKDLDDNFLGQTKTSSLFREISATHFIPYHLIVKWGSIYHRYKKYILENTDILSGCLTSGLTTNFNGSTFFDNNSGITFTISGTSITYSGNTDVGIHPFYDAIFHQIINGYNHYNVSSGNTSFSQNVDSGGIISYSANTNGQIYWTSFVDNSKYSNGYSGYTILPSNGYYGVPSNDNFYRREQRSMKVIWDNNDNTIDFSGKTFPSYSQYCKTYISGSTFDNVYGFDNDYRKIIDLIGTFSPNILNEFEDIFLRFASENLLEELTYKKFPDVELYTFQDLLKSISIIDKNVNDNPSDKKTLLESIISRQNQKLVSITEKIKKPNNLISFTLVNPKEIDPHVIYGFADVFTGNTFTYNEFNISQVSSNLKYIDLYVGEDIDGSYLQFFATNNVELSEENVLTFRPLIQLFAGRSTLTSEEFKQFIRSNVFVVNPTTALTNRQNIFLQKMISKFSTLNKEQRTQQRLDEKRGYNDDPLRLELYSYFKSFNDKWIGGNSIGQRLLFEEFLFLDKANRDIGNEAYFNLQRLIPLGNSKNQKATLYSVISMLVQGTGFDMRVLPSYVNFYGANYSNRNKMTPSKNIAKNLFGTYLEVDYQESTPKVIIQYTGPTSKHPDLSKYSKEYRYSDDSFYVGNTNKNPLIITTPEVFKTGDLFKSNRVVAFEVSFGDGNQGIFKGIELDQSSIKNTTESFIAMENLARSESGSNAYQVDIGLFDVYRQASYTCTITSMGNVMIQPTMYFYLKNVPMFRGTYWITDVRHNIKNNTIVTTFTGTRIPYSSLPDPKDSMMASYKPLFDTITQRAISRIKQRDRLTTTNEYSVKLTDNTSRIVNLGENRPEGNVLPSLIVPESSYTNYGVPFNGFIGNDGNPEEYIQKIKIKGSGKGTGEWLRTNVVLMGGNNNPLSDETQMSLFYRKNPKSEIKWGDIKGKSNDSLYYSTRFLLNKVTPDKIMGGTTIFYNPAKNIEIVVKHEYDTESTNKIIKGAVSVGPKIPQYGIAMSKKLMTELKLEKDGDVVYFRIV